MKLIAKKMYKGVDGPYRTQYYQIWDGINSRPIMGAKKRAIRLEEGEARAACKQLNELRGGGFFIVPDGERMRRALVPHRAEEARA